MFRKLTSAATFALTMLITLVITACNPNSDAVSVLQSENTSLRATIGSYESIAGPTATAQAGLNAQKLVVAQTEVANLRATVKDLTARMNSGAANAPSNSTGVMDSAGANTAGNVQPNNGAAGGNLPADPNAFAFNSLLTARGKTAEGCASGQSNIFTVNDTAIWVIADVRNYKKGTNFAVKWSGGTFTHENDWTVPSGGAQICVHFYIEPTTLDLQPGTYTVTMTAGELPAQQVTFTVQADPAANGGANGGAVSTESASGK